jgi:hypothetical protein
MENGKKKKLSLVESNSTLKYYKKLVKEIEEEDLKDKINKKGTIETKEK